MSDIDDSWRREESKERRAHNRENGLAALKERSIHVEQKNNGFHLIVKHGDKVVDYWPGTGLWMDRAVQSMRRRGIRSLLTHLGVK